MAKKKSSALVLGAAGLAGAWFLLKNKGPLTTPLIAPAPDVTPQDPSVPGIDTTSAAYLTAVANAAQAAAAKLPAGCQQTPYGVVCPSNFNNPTLNPPTPLICPSGYKANSGNTACEQIPAIVSPPPPPITAPSTAWETSCYQGAVWRRPVGSGGIMADAVPPYGTWELTSQGCALNTTPANNDYSAPSKNYNTSPANVVEYDEYCENGFIYRRPRGSPGVLCSSLSGLDWMALNHG